MRIVRMTGFCALAFVTGLLVLPVAPAAAQVNIKKVQVCINSSTGQIFLRSRCRGPNISRLDGPSINSAGDDALSQLATVKTDLESQLGALSNQLTALDGKVAPAVESFIPFQAAMNFGEEQELLSNGSVSWRARCIEDEGGSHVLRVFATATENGWFSLNTSGVNSPRSAGEEAVEFTRAVPVGGSSAGRTIDRGIVIGPQGNYLGIQGETMALAINTFGDACVVMGVGFSQQLSQP